MDVLVTGGAGFIGSNLVARLVERGDNVRVLDNFSTGLKGNVSDRAELVEGDVTDERLVRKASRGVQVVFHLAAHTSVPRSLDDPLATNWVNTQGTLCVLQAARENGVRRVVASSSSSVYGGTGTLPSKETEPCWPRSPYAVSKLAAEHYCRVFAQLHGLEAVALRYFNVYGPGQRPGSRYAAAVPLFVQALSRGQPPVIYGDGQQSRDFTFVTDVVDANLAAASAPAEAVAGRVLNIAYGRSHTLVELLATLGRVMGVVPQARHLEARPGDVRHSLADITAARAALGFEPKVGLEEGLRRTVEWASTWAPS